MDPETGIEEVSTAASVQRTREEWEQLRRSIAMLPTGAWALRREPSLGILTTLISELRKAQDQSD